MKKESRTDSSRTLAIWFMVGYYTAATVFYLMFLAFDLTSIVLAPIVAMSALSAIGIFFQKKVGFWLALAFLPLLGTVASLALFNSVNSVGLNPNWQVALFHVCLILMLLGLILTLVLLIDKRSKFH